MTHVVVAWLVDIGYVVKASDGKFRLDYVATEKFLQRQLGTPRTFLFNGFDPAYGIQAGLKAFYNSMRLHGMQVRLQPMQSGAPGTNRQRRVDVDFSAHLMWQASRPEIETVVLTTGDQDFVPAVELAREQFQKTIILFTYEGMVNQDLIASVDAWWKFEHQEAQLARP